jgi:hypothetical protein
MNLFTSLLVVTCGTLVFLLIQANIAVDSQYFHMKTEVYAAYRYACVENANKTIIDCGMEADDYIEEYLKK